MIRLRAIQRGKRGINVLMKSTIFGYIALYDVWDKNQHTTWNIVPYILNGFAASYKSNHCLNRAGRRNLMSTVHCTYLCKKDGMCVLHVTKNEECTCEQNTFQDQNNLSSVVFLLWVKAGSKDTYLIVDMFCC